MKILIVLVLLLLLAAIWDFYQGKIPNIFIFTGCCYGLVRLLYYGEVLKFLPGIFFPIIVLFPFYKIGVIGAGDIKLFSVLGFYFPFMESVFCIFTSFLIGAVISIISFIHYGNFGERMTYFFSYLKECIYLGHFRYYYLDSKGRRICDMKHDNSKIHFAIPIFISVLFHLGGVFL